MDSDAMVELPVYGVSQPEKEIALLRALNHLSRLHFAGCAQYARLIGATGGVVDSPSLDTVPWLPVALFKSHRLASIPDAEIFKVLTSSGTTGQAVSRISLDRPTAVRQTKALSRIMSSILGPERLPMLIIDTPGVVRDRTSFAARGAGVLGMMSFGRQHRYVLDDNFDLDIDAVDAFLLAHGGGPFLMFGFTYLAWEYFFAKLRGRGTDLSNGVLVHSGGWKRMQDKAVDAVAFRRLLEAEFGLRRVYNFYGMVEQVGSVFLEGDDGFLYPPSFADVIVRDPITWREQTLGVPGVIQVLSALPTSYPGHSLLTEDWGVVHGVDDSAVGRCGKRFSILGRIAKSELRGCSDVTEVPPSA